jgi:hypothetical protein
MRHRPIPGAPSIFFQGDISPIMQTILLTSMLAHDLQEPRGPGRTSIPCWRCGTSSAMTAGRKLGRRSSSTRASGTRPVNRNAAKRGWPLRWTGARGPRHFLRQRSWQQKSSADQTAPQRPRRWSPHRGQRPRVGLRRIIRGGECPLAERNISLQDHERLHNFDGHPP